jgi:hypothetical protein
MTEDVAAKAKRLLDLHADTIQNGCAIVEAEQKFYQAAHDALPSILSDYAKLGTEFDANVERLKACEHIAVGDEGWEALRNECPSTAAVARLRDDYAKLRERVRELDNAIDGIWQYGADTLSGRTDGPDDRKWQRDAVLEMTRRARALKSGET